MNDRDKYGKINGVIDGEIPNDETWADNRKVEEKESK